MILTLLISINEISKLVILYVSLEKHLVTTPDVLAKLLSIWLLCQLFGNYLQGKWSDHWQRKQVLTIAVAASLAGLFFLLFAINYKRSLLVGGASALLWLALFFDGMLGNIAPIAKAAFLDQNPHRSKRSLFAIVYICQSWPWICLPLGYLLLDPSIERLVIFGILCLFIGFILSFFWKDPKDADKQKITPFPIKNKYVMYALCAFLFSQIVYQTISYLIEQNTDPLLISRSYILLGMGVGVGSLACLLFKEPTNHRHYVSWIFLLGFGFFALKFLSFSWRHPTEFLDNSNLTFLALFSGLYLPSVFAMLTDKAHVHQQGAVCGLLESIMSLGELSAPYIAFCLLTLQYNWLFLSLGIILFLAGMLLKIPAQFPANRSPR